MIQGSKEMFMDCNGHVVEENRVSGIRTAPRVGGSFVRFVILIFWISCSVLDLALYWINICAWPESDKSNL